MSDRNFIFALIVFGLPLLLLAFKLIDAAK